MAQGNERAAAYAAIYASLRCRIFTGQLQPGDMLPSESQLCAEFGVSRETVRKGLKQLDSEGLIFSRPKIGYFVCVPDQSDLTLYHSEELQRCTVQYCDIHGSLPDGDLQEKLQIPADRKIIELVRLFRSEQGRVEACEVKYVPYERAYPSVESEMRYAVLPDITFSKMASYEYYTEVSVSAVTAQGRTAELLACPPSEPLLLTERIFIRQDGIRIGYSRHYSRQPVGMLHGISGHKFKN